MLSTLKFVGLKNDEVVPEVGVVLSVEEATICALRHKGKELLTDVAHAPVLFLFEGCGDEVDRDALALLVPERLQNALHARDLEVVKHALSRGHRAQEQNHCASKQPLYTTPPSLFRSFPHHIASQAPQVS